MEVQDEMFFTVTYLTTLDEDLEAEQRFDTIDASITILTTLQKLKERKERGKTTAGERSSCTSMEGCSSTSAFRSEPRLLSRTQPCGGNEPEDVTKLKA